MLRRAANSERTTGSPGGTARGGWLRGPNRSLFLAVLVAAAWTLAFFLRARSIAFEHDTRGYIWMAQLMTGAIPEESVPREVWDTLFSVRLAGYPGFLTPFTAIGLTGEGLRAAVTVVQFIAYVASVVFLERAVVASGGRRAARRISVALLVLPFPYILVVEVLTETLSLALTLAVTAASLLAEARPAHRWRWYGAAACMAGMAVLIRPDNPHVAVIPVAVAGAHAWLRFRSGDARLAGGAGLTAAVAALTGVVALAWRVPQFLMTHWYFGTGNLDLPTSSAVPEFRVGVTILKWVTGVGDVSGAVTYRNPFLTLEDAQRYGDGILRWYTDEPVQGLALVGLKYFALVDQDAPYVYNTSIPDGAPWWVFVINHALVVLGIAGAVTAAMRFRRLGPGARAAVLALALTAAAWLAVHALPHVEARYGLPALTGLAILAGWFATRERLKRAWIALAVTLVLYLPAAYVLSDWLRDFRTG